MGKYRRDRINEEMTRELCELVRTVKDPRVAKHLVSVIRCEVTADLKYAKVFYSYMDAKEKPMSADEIKAGLKSAQGYLRGQIAERLNLRITPELQFIYDESIAYGAKINTIMNTEKFREDIRRFEERAAEEAATVTATAGEDEFDD